MDFFEAQARAKKRTGRLVALFGVAVVGTIITGYVATIIGLHAAGNRPPGRSRYGYYRSVTPDEPLNWWQPRAFAAVVAATLAVVGGAALYKWSEYSDGGAVSESLGGRRVDPHTTSLDERRLLNVVEEMAIASGIGVPAVYVLDDEPAINAFAAGLTTADATVTVSRGALEKLSRDELQGVVGHEFSHILNGDMRLNLRIAAIVFGILVLGLAGRGVIWSLRGVRLRGRNSSGAIAVIFLIGIGLLIIGYVGYFFGRIIQAAVSRQREFLADASAVQFTRNPGGITGALKKIGGYALGSSMLHNQSAAIGHFFFAQSFATGITGLWATHPPLEQRIRAIDPQFDGKFFDPPEKIDVAHESFVQAGLVPTSRASLPLTATDPDGAAELAARHFPVSPLQAVASVGTLTPEQIANAQTLLAGTPARLRTAAQSATEARVLLFGLLLDDADDAVRARQRALVGAKSGADALHLLDELEPALRQMRVEQKLPLLQLALPALRPLPPSGLAPFFDTLDELVYADGRISTFEFALQKLLLRTLAVGRAPGAAVAQIYSFHAVTPEIELVLTVLARASSDDATAAAAAFAAGAAELKQVESELHFLDSATANFAALDKALDTLAAASLPIKQRTIYAAAHVVCADGQVRVAEFELLRAIAAALDCPMPPLLGANFVE